MAYSFTSAEVKDSIERVAKDMHLELDPAKLKEASKGASSMLKLDIDPRALNLADIKSATQATHIEAPSGPNMGGGKVNGR